MTTEGLVSTLKDLIISELDLRGRTPQDIVDDDPLFGSGLGLDSLDALQLSVAIEERFGVQLPGGEEAKEVFASVSSLAQFIHRAKNEVPA